MDLLSPDEKSSRVIGVAELNRRAKELIERNLPLMWIGGEISNFMRAASGHCYFSLKDAQAQVRCVMFRHKAQLHDWKPENGMQVEVRATPSFYEARGEFQLNVETMRRAGLGALYAAFEQLKAKLQAEGLFDAQTKQELPRFPRAIGIVTSPQAAALRDVLTTLRRRMPSIPVILDPVPVQGEGAGAKIAAAIAAADARAECDVLIVCRGGGSIEDLWAFNEEPLVRAVAACNTPVISAVGHEIDFTLCDFAADVRAETPSAAAELITSHFVAALERARQADAGMTARIDAALERAAADLDHARSRLRLLTPAARLEQCHLRLDDFSNRLSGALRHSVQLRRQELADLRAGLAQHSPETRVQLESHRLLSLWKRLQAASPASVLNRGFVILRDDAGQAVTRRAALRPGQALTGEFADGKQALRSE